MIRLEKTCDWAPEQYDAFDDNNNMVGYLRLRHGVFYVQCPDVGGDTVYHEFPDGDGSFEPNEREHYLNEAIKSIEKWLDSRKV